MQSNIVIFSDKGDNMRIAVITDASIDATGLFARSQKLAGTVEQVRKKDKEYHHLFSCQIISCELISLELHQS